MMFYGIEIDFNDCNVNAVTLSKMSKEELKEKYVDTNRYIWSYSAEEFVYKLNEDLIDTCNLFWFIL